MFRRVGKWKDGRKNGVVSKRGRWRGEGEGRRWGSKKAPKVRVLVTHSIAGCRIEWKLDTAFRRNAHHARKKKRLL